MIALRVEPIAEKTVEALPPGPLQWTVDRFSSLESARAAEGPWSLAAEAWGQAWLFTLGPRDAPTSGGERAAEIGPVSAPTASRFLLRANLAEGPPGARTPVHSHPGSEAFYVLRGQLSQRTSHGVVQVDAGQVLNGHEPGMAMQLESSGAQPLEQIVLFLVDADAPFSRPADF